MNNSAKRRLAYSAVLTAGVICILTGIRWLLFLGLALVLVSSILSARRPASRKPLLGLIICLGYGAWVLVQSYREGTTFSREPVGIVFLVLFIGAWLWALILEWFQLRGLHRTQKDA